jgi:hypothetical protein
MGNLPHYGRKVVGKAVCKECRLEYKLAENTTYLKFNKFFLHSI